MPWIQNVSLSDVRVGFHIEAGENSMLIQIVDFNMEFPVPLKQFKEVHQFHFMDVEKSDPHHDDIGIQDQQAARLVALLQQALDKRMNVIVHCVAGLCRSGAVAEVGIMMGFDDTEKIRSPNLLVKHKMMKVLGWTYDENEPYTVNGKPFVYDETGSRIWLFAKD